MKYLLRFMLLVLMAQSALGAGLPDPVRFSSALETGDMLSAREWLVLAPLVVGRMLAVFPGRQDLIFAQFAAVVLAGLAVVLALGEETKGRSLETV